MYVRRILLASINAAVILALSAHAQQNPAPAAGAQAQGDQPARKPGVFQYLGLSTDQKREWQRIQRETDQSVWAARRDESLNEQQMQRRLREIHAEQRRQFLELLTPQQQDALRNWWEQQKQQQQARAGNEAPDQAASGTSAAPNRADGHNDDFFAGMEQDDDPAARPAQARNQKKPSPPQN